MRISQKVKGAVMRILFDTIFHMKTNLWKVFKSALVVIGLLLPV